MASALGSPLKIDMGSGDSGLRLSSGPVVSDRSNFEDFCRIVSKRRFSAAFGS
jgi:hypothetical protein